MSNYKSNSIDIQQCYIVNFEGSVLEISNIMSGFELTESIFNKTMSIDLMIDSSVGLIEKFPIVGEEFLVLHFKTPGEKRVQKHLFYIDSVNNRKSKSELNETFTLHGISIEEVASKFYVVQEAFHGRTASDIISLAFYDFRRSIVLGNGTQFSNSKKSISVEGETEFLSVTPNKKYIFDFIDFIIFYSKSARYIESDFLFYETSKAFNFRSVSSLSEHGIVDSFYYGVIPGSDILDKGKIKNYQAINSFTFNNTIDVSNNIDMGLYDSEISYLDLITKTYKEKRFQYNNDFSKLNSSLGKNKLITKNGLFSVLQPNSPNRSLIISNDIDSRNLSEYINNVRISIIKDKTDGPLLWPTKRHEFLSARKSKAAQLVNTISLNISIPGNTSLVAGDTINVFIPEASVTKDSLQSHSSFLGKSEPKCLITHVKHVYLNSQYYTILKCVKTGFETKIKSRDTI